MRTLFLATALLLGGGFFLLEPAPPEKPAEKAKEEAGPVEIDFSPLPPANSDKYEVTITIDSKDGPTFREAATVVRIKPELVRNHMKTALKLQEWTATEVGETKLIVESYKGSPVTKVEIKVEGEGVKDSMTPTVKRVKEDKKEEKK
jgi:hypothetical protein